MNYQDWRFYGLIGGCLLAAGVLVALMLGGEVAGPRVAETPSHPYSGLTVRAWPAAGLCASGALRGEGVVAVFAFLSEDQIP